MSQRRGTRQPARTVLRTVLGGVVVGGLLAGCAWFGGDGPEAVSVFELAPGDCVLSPVDVAAELTELERVECDVEHHMEVYARVELPQADGDAAQFPGDAATKNFADGSCAEEFTDYVGISYLDSSLWFTYLVPSARSWAEGGDRTVTCFVTTTGAPLTQSVAGSRL